MARVLGLEEIPPELRQELNASLRVCDEAIVLPTASRSAESGAFKNVVLRFAGNEPNVSADVFSSNWFSGISLVPVDTAQAEVLLRDSAKRQAALKKLTAAISSEMADSEVQVGPKLDASSDDRDVSGWVAGFDGPSCCVGLYSARLSRAPESGMGGMSRTHNAYYLVAKAGGGVAAQTFHSRLVSSLRAGRSLDDSLETGDAPGPQALRRVALAGKRNRARILAIAAETLGFSGCVDTITDASSAPDAPHRGAITMVDVTYNAIRKIDTGGMRSTWQYVAGAADAALSHGAISSSNVAEGFLTFTTKDDNFRVSLRNDAYDCLPFVTPRIEETRALCSRAARAHEEARKTGKPAHPDHAFVQERFAWKTSIDKGIVEPPCLWGSHLSEAFLSNWARELGVANLKSVRLSPELVTLAALEPAKMRAIVRKLEAINVS